MTERYSLEPEFSGATDMGASPAVVAGTEEESRSELPPIIGGSRARFSKTATTNQKQDR